jgi:hypothetical protein
MWRLRSLAAMGHDATRIARALGMTPRVVQRLLAGHTATVTPELRELACRLWDAWWDKTPPARTPAQRRAAATARNTAARNRWCQPAGLDEDRLDEPGYRPYSIWRPATGTGTAPDTLPPASVRPAPATGRPRPAGAPQPSHPPPGEPDDPQPRQATRPA